MATSHPLDRGADGAQVGLPMVANVHSDSTIDPPFFHTGSLPSALYLSAITRGMGMSRFNSAANPAERSRQNGPQPARAIARAMEADGGLHEDQLSWGESALLLGALLALALSLMSFTTL